MLQVRENEMSLRKWSDGAAQLRASEEHWMRATVSFSFRCYFTAESETTVLKERTASTLGSY